MENQNKDFELLQEQFNNLVKKQSELNQDLLSFRIELNKYQSVKTDLIENNIEQSTLNTNTEIDNSNITQNSANQSNLNSNITSNNISNNISKDNQGANYQNNYQDLKFQEYIRKTQHLHKTTNYKQNNDKKIKSFEIKSNIEKFIGENLINKIGILFTIIGVAIGAKYAIDNQLISPLTRIILGYLVGIGLLLFAFKLKEKYENFSSVLFSGSMTIMYFITFFAYTLYNLMPQLVTFVLMVIFTIFTVLAATNYKKQIVALLGLVGAYAVPYLLSDGSGRVVILFSYVTLLNLGILYLSIKMKWDKLLYTTFGLTWLIFISWYTVNYQKNDVSHVYIASAFLLIYFVKFYFTLIIKLSENISNISNLKNINYEKFLPIMINNLLFFSFGYSILNTNNIGQHYTGLFTVFNALIHLGVTYYFNKKATQDKNIVNIFLGLVLIFITLAIPIQFVGNWVTLFIALEALILFGFGRTKLIKIFEFFSYPLIVIAFLSLVNDWQDNYRIYIYNEDYENVKNTMLPFLNVHLLSSFIFIIIYGCMYYVNNKYLDNLNENLKDNEYTNYDTIRKFLYVIPIIFTLSLFFAFYVEITYYWKILYENSSLVLSSGETEIFKKNQNLWAFKDITLMLYSIFFYNVVALLNVRKMKNTNIANISSLIILALNFLFLFIVITSFNQLHNNYIYNYNSEYFNNTIFNILIRYISYIFILLSIYTINLNLKLNLINNFYKKSIELYFYFISLVILSNELLLWYDFFRLENSTKLVLSIFWGVYSLTLIALGIWKNKQHLRLSAIVLFGVTILKLFFYDLAHLNTISKTILFITLGVILLVISFLYNKYKHLIIDEKANNSVSNEQNQNEKNGNVESKEDSKEDREIL